MAIDLILVSLGSLRVHGKAERILNYDFATATTTHIFHLSSHTVFIPSSPFGLRCSNFHDPRVAGVNSSWLPHLDVPMTYLQTDLNVDKTHYQSIAALSQKNPLVQNMIWNLRPSLKNKKRNAQVTDADTEWRDTYSLVCNLTSLNPVKKTKDGSFNSTVHKLKMSELQKLCIAIKMNNCGGSNGRIEYVYKPEHVVYNELCMLVSYIRALGSFVSS